MRRPAFVALLTACAVTIGISASIGRTVVGAEADDQASRPLSRVPLVERFGQAALDAQAEFIRAMPSAQVRFGENGAVSRITGRTGIVLEVGLGGFKLHQSSRELLDKLAPVLLSAGTEELRPVRIYSDAATADASERQRSPERTIKLRQYIRGREVLAGWVNISLNQQTNEITGLAANFLPDRGLQHEPKLTAAEARAMVEASLRDSTLEEAQKIVFADTPARLAYAFEEIGDNGGIGGLLVWVFKVSRSGSHEVLEASVSAATGQVMQLQSLTPGIGLQRWSYTAGYTAPNPVSFPNGLTFTAGEQDLLPDLLALDAYNHAGTTYNAFRHRLNRLSWDGADAIIKLVTHYAMDPGIAFYHNGYLVFSDGMSGVMGSAAQDQDSVAHEFGHGVTATEAGFITSQNTVDGAAALDEAFGDWSSTVVDVHVNGAASPSTWAILMQDPGKPQGVRNWQFPTLAGVQYRDWFPTRSFLSTNVPPGGQYLNSTIMGHAFYLLANGGQHSRAGIAGSGVPVIPVTGIQYESARNIFYDGLRSMLIGPNASFFDLRDATVAVAPATQQESVRQAWNAVGVGYNCTSAPEVPNLIVWPHYCKGRYDLEWPAVPGAMRYHGQVAPANLGWAFAATIVDGNVTSCYQDLPRNYWMVRLRACNACGCSAWSLTQYLEYWNTCA